MNYLAHAFLSNNNKDLLVGNFIADHVRGKDFSAYTPEIAEGIYLHRHIDAFTDAHPEFKKSKRLFYDGFERYSGVLVDIYFDHLLAANFSRYSDVPLQQFSKQVYTIYTAHEHLLPDTSRNFLDYVIKNNVYVDYADINGIERVLSHLSHRIRHNVQLDRSVALFKAHQQQLKDNFTVFFEDAVTRFNV